MHNASCHVPHDCWFPLLSRKVTQPSCDIFLRYIWAAGNQLCGPILIGKLAQKMSNVMLLSYQDCLEALLVKKGLFAALTRSKNTYLWIGRNFLVFKWGLFMPRVCGAKKPPSFTLDDPVRTTQHLLDRVYLLIPLAFRPSHIAPLAPPPIIQGCFRNHINSTLLTIEREGFPIYYGHTPVTSHAVAAQSLLAVFPPNSPLPRTLHKFQSLVPRPPNCYIQFKLCACGSVHGYLTSLTDLDAATPLFVGDPPVDHLDFVIQFDGGAFREHRVGGSGIVLWKHTTQGLTLLDTFAVPLFPI